jgi:WD domain, G-beta repeat
MCKATTYEEYRENMVNLIQFPPVLSFTGADIFPEEEWIPWDPKVDAFFDPITVIEKTTIPVLAFFGEKDTQVDPFQGAQAYEQALQKAGNQHYRVENLFRSLVFSPDGTLLAAGSNNNIIRLWDVAGGGLTHTIQHDTGKDIREHILDLAFSPDGRVFVSGGTDGIARLWDVQSWQVVHELNTGDAPTGLAFSPDGAILASSGPRLQLWDVKSGKLLRTLPHSDLITVAFSPDGTLLASAGYDQQICL